MDDAGDKMQIRDAEAESDRSSNGSPFLPRTDGGPDSCICSKARLSDIVADSFSRYRQHLKTLRPNHPWNSLSDEDLLIAIGAADHDDDGVLRPTIAGALMFSTDRVITRELPEYFLEYIVRNPLDERLDERITSIDGDWSGNVFDFMLRVMQALSLSSDKPFELKGFVRVDDTDRMKAERELAVNALAHADYHGKEGVHMDISHEVLKIRSPGRFRMPVERALSGGNSDPGNKTMMKMLRLIGFAERAGNGLHRVMAVCDKERIPRPEISESTEPASVTVAMRRVPGMKVQDDADLLEYIRKYSTETLAQMAEGTGLSTSTLSRRLKEFKDRGAVERVGGRRSGFWTVKVEDR